MNLIPNIPSERNLVFYFQVHQPKRLKTLRFFDIGSSPSFFNDMLNQQILKRVAQECYLPTNDLLLALIHKNPKIKIAFSISGILIDQLEEYAPEVLKSFRKLADTGNVEFLSETYYHSLSSIMTGNEFELQVAKHQQKIAEHFGITSSVFRNTELIYNDEIGKRVHDLGFKGIFTDAAKKILHDNTPHHLYEHPQESKLKILLRNFRLSDEIAFRFSDYNLTADQYIKWIETLPESEELINIAMDYETFGEHKKKESGIFTFLSELLTKISSKTHLHLMTPSEVINKMDAKTSLSVTNTISWADTDRDLSAWLGNDMQRDAFDSLVKMEKDIKNVNDSNLLRQWRNLQVSDHFYYMSTKEGSNGEVHSYFSPYASPYEAFINYMNILTDFSMQVNRKKAALAVKPKIISTMFNQSKVAQSQEEITAY